MQSNVSVDLLGGHASACSVCVCVCFCVIGACGGGGVYRYGKRWL